MHRTKAFKPILESGVAELAPPAEVDASLWDECSSKGHVVAAHQPGLDGVLFVAAHIDVPVAFRTCNEEEAEDDGWKEVSDHRFSSPQALYTEV